MQNESASAGSHRLGYTSDGAMTRWQVRVCASSVSEAASTTVRACRALTQGCAREACSPLVSGRSRATILNCMSGSQ